MKSNELPSICPFCKKDHTIDVLRLQITSIVKCPHCKKEYFIPYSEVKNLLKFQSDLDDLTKDSSGKDK
jgi:ribosomal protein L37AE/L43A